MKRNLVFLAYLPCAILIACSSDGGYRHGTSVDYSEQSSAPGWAYGADSFTVDKDEPERSKNSYEFYYKHCDLTSDNLPFYSKTAYECTGPY